MSSSSYQKRVAAIEKLLGLANVQPDSSKQGAPVLQSYAEGYGPARTLVEINFDAAPGFYVYDNDNPPKEAGDEPPRKNGDVFVQRFLSSNEVLAVPIYQLAEQVAQIMRYLNLPAEFVVELTRATPLDPSDPAEHEVLRLTTGEWPPARTNTKKAPYLRAFQERADGVISMLPELDRETGLARLQRRAQDQIVHRPGGERWPARLNDGIVFAQRVQIDGASRDMEVEVEGDYQAEQGAPYAEFIPQAGQAVIVQEAAGGSPVRKRQRLPSPPSTQLMRWNVTDTLGLGEYPEGGVETDTEIIAYIAQGTAFGQE